MELSPEEVVRGIVDRYLKLGRIGKRSALELVPKEERRYKCFACKKAFDYPGEELVCPNCGVGDLEIMCPLDHCHCSHNITMAIRYCALCGDAVCPECGTHDVVQISRVTGYYQVVGGWNASKQQELKDRHRYVVA